MTEQTMTTNEQVARALGWTDVRGNPTGVPEYRNGIYAPRIPDYAHSVDACGELLAWAAERGWGVILSVVRADEKSIAHVTFGLVSSGVDAGKVADTPTHALAGAICAAWLALAAKLQEVTA